jgi:heme/copper-type cytochrome/quinol oxidase subunit 1
MIRIELATPGSLFFKGDSIRYLQVITAHGLTMIFFVVVPLVFGSAGNFFIPYHVGSKDVAFPTTKQFRILIITIRVFVIGKTSIFTLNIFTTI